MKRGFTPVELFAVSGSERKAFTLVELLVVVAIIVILMAMMIPALESAIYQAELVQCGARQKTMGTTFQLYTSDHKRYYPTNLERRQSQPWAQPDFIGMESEPTRDFRSVVWPGYLTTLDFFICPLSGEISAGYEANNAETRVFSNYLIFAGWNYPKMLGNANGGGMLRFGDTLKYINYQTNAVEESNTLLMDNHISTRLPYEPIPLAQSSHPSRSQELRHKVRVNQDMDDVEPGGFDPILNPVPTFGVPGVGTQLTYSVWVGGNEAKIDLNTMGTDLSVSRFNQVERYDGRFRPAQIHADYTKDQSVHIYLPN